MQNLLNPKKKISRVDVEIFLLSLRVYIPFLIICIATAIVSGKIIETVMLLCIFYIIRYAFPKTFHFLNNDWLCFAFSCVQFIIVIPHTIPIGLSLFGSVISAFVIGIASYYVQDYIDNKKYNLQQTTINIETATDEQIESIGKILHYKRDKIDLAKKFFVEKLSNKQVLEWLCEKRMNVEYDTVIQYRYRILKDLKKFKKK